MSVTIEKRAEKLCQTLNLGGARSKIFDNFLRVIQDQVVLHCDIKRRSHKQLENVQSLVQEIVELFPGYLNNAHPNEQERIDSLRLYLCCYLDEDLVGSTAEDSSSSETGSEPEPESESDSDLDADVFSDPEETMQTRGRESTPFFSSPMDGIVATETSSMNHDEDLDLDDSRTSDASFVSAFAENLLSLHSSDDCDPLNAITQFLTHCKPSMEHCAASLQSAGVFVGDHLVGMSRWSDETLSHFLISNEIANSADELQAMIEGFARILADSPPPEHLESPDPVTEFCENCYPSMGHCADPFRVAGVVDWDALIGMSKWSDDGLSHFLKTNKIALTPLERQALIVGFSCLLLESTRPASAMSL
ncbi:hypothetical protein R3P38DRAFT_2855197 [Favolaschia claudopus]|uniref:Uncharacterized protein n=1 Tax=Favolaschia claudopus TaxID=2862362 RepID=A0AAW0DS74_9AGAR